MEENTTRIDDDDNAGKGFGIIIFILIIIGTVFSFLTQYRVRYLSSPCFTLALALAFILACASNNCCAKKYNLKPHVKKMATATLVTLVLLFIASTITTVMAIQTAGYDINSFPNASNIFILGIHSIIGYVLIGLALIFSGIFTWGRKCCGAQRA
jgi:hypothetical protein